MHDLATGNLVIPDTTIYSWIQVTGLLFKRHSPQNLFITNLSLNKSLACLHSSNLVLNLPLLLQSNNDSHCYINRWLMSCVFPTGLWVIGMACLAIQTCFWKMFSLSYNMTCIEDARVFIQVPPIEKWKKSVCVLCLPFHHLPLKQKVHWPKKSQLTLEKCDKKWHLTLPAIRNVKHIPCLTG